MGKQNADTVEWHVLTKVHNTSILYIQIKQVWNLQLKDVNIISINDRCTNYVCLMDITLYHLNLSFRYKHCYFIKNLKLGMNIKTKPLIAFYIKQITSCCGKAWQI